MKLEQIINEGIGSEIKRKLTGKVTGVHQASRIAIQSMQKTINLIKVIQKDDTTDPTRLREFLDDIRREHLDAIKALKKIEG